MARDLRDVHRRFAALWADGQPVRGEDELAAALRAAGLSPEQVTDEWLRELEEAWVYGDSDEPFADERVNRVYRREIGG